MEKNGMSMGEQRELSVLKSKGIFQERKTDRLCWKLLRTGGSLEQKSDYQILKHTSALYDFDKTNFAERVGTDALGTEQVGH